MSKVRFRTARQAPCFLRLGSTGRN